MSVAAAETIGGAAGAAVDSYLSEISFMSAQCENQGDLITVSTVCLSVSLICSPMVLQLLNYH